VRKRRKVAIIAVSADGGIAGVELISKTAKKEVYFTIYIVYIMAAGGS
jgi:hypothetical protein